MIQFNLYEPQAQIAEYHRQAAHTRLVNEALKARDRSSMPQALAQALGQAMVSLGGRILLTTERRAQVAGCTEITRRPLGEGVMVVSRCPC
jgi:hypothetical protein